ncbi:hypothetical protein DUNSADRAFT_5294 [Dunaliella salina]|uniref:Encoded protein n=1 Tax=Dunaliella salina TaxID=3046 RepID=A0ABZ3KA38_DUNSA|nr:hypothetical protein DUNSADRAFT_5294 [Dunaliella salina]|eukprot:KAF5826036.1 hypothetical protein DUNSADRAFT_5294 [Dunaliella salina]
MNRWTIGSQHNTQRGRPLTCAMPSLGQKGSRSAGKGSWSRWRKRMRLTRRRLPTGCKRMETSPRKMSSQAQSGEKRGSWGSFL